MLAKAGAASVCEAHKVMDRVVTQSHLEPLPDVYTPFPKILSVTRLYLSATSVLLTFAPVFIQLQGILSATFGESESDD